MILVTGHIDGRDLPLAEGIIEGVVDLADGDAELCGSLVAIDHKIGFKPLVLLIAVDVRQVPIALQGGCDLRRPLVELLERRSLQGELILRIAGTAADPDILHGLKEQGCARYHRHFTP